MNNVEYYPGAIDAGGCISNGWEMVKRNYGLYLGISLIAIILVGCIPCVSIFIAGPVLAGVYFVVLRDMRGESVEFGMMFKGFEKFVPLMIVGLVQSVPEVIGQVLRFGVNLGQLGLSNSRNQDINFFQNSDLTFGIASGLLVVIAIVAFVFIIFSVVWRVLLFFAVPLAMERNLNAVDAMKLSVRAATSNLGGLVLLMILEGLVGLLGFIMCIFGIFFISIPVIYVANVFAYRQVFPLIEQQFNTAPPPPGSYGSSFGQGL